MKTNRGFIVLVLIVAGLFRIALTSTIFHGDIITQAGWGKWIFDNGIKGFYENNVWTYGWPNHPLIINWIYSLGFHLYSWINTILILLSNFIAMNHLGAGHMPWLFKAVEWWGNAKFSDTPFKYGELISMKMFPIIGDLVVGLMIYKILIKQAGSRLAKLGLLIYLFSPFSWYESAIWGQNDQLNLIFLMLALYMAIDEKKSIWSPLLLTISILIKPTSFIFGPLFIWIAFKNKQTFVRMFIGGLLALLAYFGLTKIFSNLDFVTFNLKLQQQMFVKGEYWTWVNTFNFWRLTTPYLTDYRYLFLGLTLKTWGYVMYAIINWLAFIVNRKRDWMGTLRSIFVLSFGGWLTMVTMHERYYFIAVTIGIILMMINKKLIKYWWMISIIFWINLYNGWWYPEFLGWLKNILTWGNFMDGPVPKILAAVNCLLFIVITLIIWRDSWSSIMSNGLQTSITTKTLRKTWKNRNKK